MAQIQEFFGEYLPNKLTSNPDLAASINAIYQFDIDGAGTWTGDLTQDGGVISEGANENPGCVVTDKSKDFLKLLDKPASGMMLFTMGKLKVSNISLGMALQKLLA